ncbi:AbrB/MazE/SpoVT family DNA-binding domain-containing protein [Mesorhizobium shangrilense]|uniref:AbrB/MazE/SpoVT family DNA-binding domain-containing protein n=1 Tax=Mesorhizobium shangrilense TaxID=460060 RepID=A0ABV2DCI2_9HYPH
MKTTIHKIDDSEGAVIPRKLLDRMNLRVGDLLETSKRMMALP